MVATVLRRDKAGGDYKESQVNIIPNWDVYKLLSMVGMLLWIVSSPRQWSTWDKTSKALRVFETPARWPCWHLQNIAGIVSCTFWQCTFCNRLSHIAYIVYVIWTERPYQQNPPSRLIEFRAGFVYQGIQSKQHTFLSNALKSLCKKCIICNHNSQCPHCFIVSTRSSSRRLRYNFFHKYSIFESQDSLFQESW